MNLNYIINPKKAQPPASEITISMQPPVVHHTQDPIVNIAQNSLFQSDTPAITSKKRKRAVDVKEIDTEQLDLKFNPKSTDTTKTVYPQFCFCDHFTPSLKNHAALNSTEKPNTEQSFSNSSGKTKYPISHPEQFKYMNHFNTRDYSFKRRKVTIKKECD
jgi:hypothetical protein